MSDLQVSHALSTHTCSLTNTQWHIHTEVQIGYQSKIRGNKRSDRMPRQQTSLWFTDRPGNTLTPLPTDTHAEKTHARAPAYWHIHTCERTRPCADASTHLQAQRRVHPHTHTHKQKVAYALHIKSHHITLGVRETFCPCRKCSLRMLPSLNIIRPAWITHRKQKAI